MSQLALSSNFGRIDQQLAGKPQPQFQPVMLDFFNFFLTTCRLYNVNDIMLNEAYFEFIYDDSPERSFFWNIDISVFNYLLNDILYENSEVVALEWIFNWTTRDSIVVKLRYKNNVEFEEVMDSLFSPRTGLARVHIEFSPYIGANSHRLRRAAKNQAE